MEFLLRELGLEGLFVLFEVVGALGVLAAVIRWFPRVIVICWGGSLVRQGCDHISFTHCHQLDDWRQGGQIHGILFLLRIVQGS